MPTKNPRLHVTLSEEKMGVLSALAKQNKQSLSKLVDMLLDNALEQNDDAYWVERSEARLKNSKGTISHAQAWAE